jgi:hypothetical protein
MNNKERIMITVKSVCAMNEERALEDEEEEEEEEEEDEEE